MYEFANESIVGVDVNAAVEIQPSPVAEAPQLRNPPASSPISPAWERAKRIIDVLLSAILLVVLSPLLAGIAVAIRLDTGGPLLFRQERRGRCLRPFMVLKFRTMYDGVSSEAHRRYIAHLVAAGVDDGPGLKKLTGDPRVTRVGRVLRQTSLDELPQLVNVLRGEMSIVGPRPALAYELEHYEPEHFARFEVRPGMTGLWQVSGRNNVSFLEMLSLDAEYARTCSPRVDALIVLQTPLALVRRSAA